MIPPGKCGPPTVCDVAGSTLVCTGMLCTVLIASPSMAHEEGAPFSGAMVDPIVQHHAHIESEERVNLAMVRTPSRGNGPGVCEAEGEAELAWGAPGHTFGFEIFLPVGLAIADGGSRPTLGSRDIEVRPLKLALYTTSEVAISTATGLILPISSGGSGTGGRGVAARQLLLVDVAAGRWFWGVNLGGVGNLSGARGGQAEVGFIWAYSFIDGEHDGGRVPSVPHQFLVVSPMLEGMVGAQWADGVPLSRYLSLLAGGSFWFPGSGWQIRSGVQASGVAVTGVPDAWVFHLQVGNHIPWPAP